MIKLLLESIEEKRYGLAKEKQWRLMMRILFQGDSITDCGRDRDEKRANLGLGNGYVNFIAGMILFDDPGHIIYNRGVSGDRIGDMYSRWIEDTMNIEFDILSVLNGVNDIGFGLRLGIGADAEEYEFIYDHMIGKVKKKRPEAKIILMEPFVTKFDNRIIDDNSDPGDIYTDWDKWRDCILRSGEVVQKIAKKYNALFVPLFDDFTRLADRDGAQCWSIDGIHPNAAGHELIARKWLKICGTKEI